MYLFIMKISFNLGAPFIFIHMKLILFCDSVVSNQLTNYKRHLGPKTLKNISWSPQLRLCQTTAGPANVLRVPVEPNKGPKLSTPSAGHCLQCD